MFGWALIWSPAPAAARSIMRANPAVVNGEPRSMTKMKGDVGLSRCSRRRARVRHLGWVAAELKISLAANHGISLDLDLGVGNRQRSNGDQSAAREVVAEYFLRICVSRSP